MILFLSEMQASPGPLHLLFLPSDLLSPILNYMTLSLRFLLKCHRTEVPNLATIALFPSLLLPLNLLSFPSKHLLPPENYYCHLLLVYLLVACARKII